MEAKVQLRVPQIGNILPQYEWQVVRDHYFGGDIVFTSESRLDCVNLIANAKTIADFTLKRVTVARRDPLSAYAKAGMKLILYLYGAGQKLSCIKAARQMWGLGLKEAKELVEDYLDEYLADD